MAKDSADVLRHAPDGRPRPAVTAAAAPEVELDPLRNG